MDSSREGPEEEREDAAGSGGAVRDAAALYRQIWGIDPEPSPPGRTRTGTLRPTAPAEPTGQDAGSDGPAARDLSPRLVALERRVLELSRRLEAEELEVARGHGRAIASLERRLAAVEGELRDTSSLERRLAELEVGLKEAGGRTDERAAGVDQRISRLEQRRSDLALSLENTVDERVQRMDSRLVDEARRIDGRMAELQQRIGAVNESLEARLRAIETRIQQVFGLFGQVAQAVDRETSAPGSSESPRDMPASTPSGEERITDTPRSSTSNMFEA